VGGVCVGMVEGCWVVVCDLINGVEVWGKWVKCLKFEDGMCFMMGLIEIIFFWEFIL